jgi:ubiquinone/menaquinone biosynthesis C-methylase UbiE
MKLTKLKNINFNSLKKKKINFRRYFLKNTNIPISEINSLQYDLQTGSYIKELKKTNKKDSKIIDENALKIISYFKKYKINSFLDFGTGECIRLFYLLKFNKISFNKIFACDTSLSRILLGKDFLKKELKASTFNKINFFCNGETMPLQNNSIDCVVSFAVFENFNLKMGYSYFDELYRVANKIIILVEPKSANITSKIRKRLNRYSLFNNLDKILKNRKILFKEDTWNKTINSKIDYNVRIIEVNKNSKKKNNYKYYDTLTNEFYNSKYNFLHLKKSGKIIPVLNNVPVFKNLTKTHFF